MRRTSRIYFTLFGVALFAAHSAVAADEQVLYRFCSQPNCVDGKLPYSPLIADGAGNLYGTTSAGGEYGLGVVFKISPSGTESVLYSFKGGKDGATPYGGLVFDSSGNILGTTSAGGGSTQCGHVGCGTVFKLAPNGTESVLHAFCLKGPICRDGISPYAGVTLDTRGRIYGTTQYGSIDTALDNGIVFRLTPEGKEKIIWSFGGGGDGANPMGGVVLEDKTIIGTTSGGGGSIYQIRNGFEKVLHFFPYNGADGGAESGLTPDGGGSFYGTRGGLGSVYKITQRRVTTLHTFGGNGGDGFEYESGVAYYAGNLYGVSVGGGGSVVYKGTIFRLTPLGAETILHWFVGSPDGDTPRATPLVAGGNLYGTTWLGGTTGCGGRGCGIVYRYGPID